MANVPMHEYVEKMNQVYHSEWQRIVLTNNFMLPRTFWQRFKMLFFKRYREYTFTFQIWVKANGPFMMHSPQVEYKMKHGLGDKIK